MRYLLLIYMPESAEMPSADVQEAVNDAYNAFTADIRERGIFEAGEALQPTTTATTVRVRNGQTLTTDGPFAETKEALGGFYLVNARDLDEAIELAARIPASSEGSIEVRPIWDIGATEESSAAVGAAG